MVAVLGLAAILFKTILPDILEATLLLLAAFLFYSLYQHLRGSGEFHLRSGLDACL